MMIKSNLTMLGVYTNTTFTIIIGKFKSLNLYLKSSSQVSNTVIKYD